MERNGERRRTASSGKANGRLEVRPARTLPQSPAAERNKRAILEVLERVLPASGEVLEIASGTGQHVMHFAAALPQLVWLPTDVDPQLLDAISRRRDAARLPNVDAPQRLDVLESPWPLRRADAVVCINMLHIAPWTATKGLLRGAAAVLPSRGPLVIYGPFRRPDRPTAPSNEAFDASLKAKDPSWGVRDLGDVRALAAGDGLRFEELVEMPANNLTVVFRKA